MAIGRTKRHSVEASELVDVLQRLRREWSFAFEGMQDDAFEQVAEGHVLKLGDGLQDFQKALLDAHAGLNPVDFDKLQFGVSVSHWYQHTTVHEFFE